MKTLADRKAETEITGLTPRIQPPAHWWWLSFVDRTSDDTGATVALHFGVAIVVATGNIEAATREAWDYHVNPGGEVLAVRLVDVTRLPKTLTYRLMTDPDDIADAQIAIAQAGGQP